MSTITLNNITSGYNVNKINDNFTTITNSVNNDVVHSNGGQNTMGQDFDLNSHNLLNVGTVNASSVKINGLPITTSQFVLGNNIVDQPNMKASYDLSLTKVANLASSSTGNGASLVGFQQAGVGATSRTVLGKLREIVHARDFGAIGNGTSMPLSGTYATLAAAQVVYPFVTALTQTFDYAGIQAAINYATTIGANVNIGNGHFVMGSSGLVLDSHLDTSFSGFRPALHGNGARQTFLDFGTGAFNCIAVLGNNTGVISMQECGDMLVSKADNLGICFYGNLLVRLILRNVRTTGGDKGFYLLDVFSTSLYDCASTFANGGLKAEKGVNSNPNEVNLFNCLFGNANQYGIDFVNPTCMNMWGGSIEGCQSSTLSQAVWGARIIITGDTLDGSVSANFNGVYFEANGNNGTPTNQSGDILYQNGAAPGSLNVIGCTFQRHAYYTTNCIRIDTSGGAQKTVNVFGCGFRGYSDYTASSSRPYILVVSPSDNVRVSDLGCTYVNPVENPNFNAPYVTASAVSSAWVRFDGTLASPVVTAGNNVTSIVKNGTGDYTVNFARALSTSLNCYSVTGINVLGVGISFIETTSSIRVKYFNMSSAPVDAQICVVVHGGQAYA